MDTLPTDIIKHELFKYFNYSIIGKLYQTHICFWVLSKEEYDEYKKIGLRAYLEPSRLCKKPQQDKLNWLNRSLSKDFVEYLKEQCVAPKNAVTFKIVQVRRADWLPNDDFGLEIVLYRPNEEDNTKLKSLGTETFSMEISDLITFLI